MNTTLFPGDREHPDVAMDADGDFVVTWTAGFFGDQKIYQQRYTAGGTPLGSETRVDTAGTESSEPSIAIDADGDYVIAWQSHHQDGSLHGVYAQRFNAAGVAQGVETRVNSTTANTQHSPAVAMDVDGDYVVVWQSEGQDGSGYGIYAQRYDAAGAPQGSETKVNTTTAGQQIEASVAMEPDGDYVVAWTSPDGNGPGVFHQRYNAAGAPQGVETRVNSTTTNDQDESSVAVAADGDYVIAWTSLDQDGSIRGIYFQRYGAGGTPRGVETRANTTTFENQYLPDLAMDAAGNFRIAWQSYAQDGQFFGVFSQRYSAEGTAVGTETQVNAFSLGEQFTPSAAMDADGDHVIAWTSDGQPDQGSLRGVYARRYRGPANVDLRLSQSANAPQVGAGGRITYRLRVANQNAEPDTDATGIAAIDRALGAASGVYVVSAVPDGATLLSTSGTGWTCGPPTTTVRCKLATAIPAGEVAPGLLLTYAAPDEAGPALHHARAYAAQVDPVATNDVEVESTAVLCSLELDAPSYSNTEAGSMAVTVTRHGTGCGSSAVSYATSAASATAVADYTEVSGSLSWSDADTDTSFSIPLVDDGLDERTEQLRILLTNPTGALLGARAQGTGLLLDNDDPPRINLTTTSSTAGEPGALVDVTVRLSEISGQQVTVVLAKAGTATFLSDYFAPKRLTIPAGQRTAEFTVEVADDSLPENDELAVIALAAPTGATLGSLKTYRLTITDDAD